jgi:protein SCO1/2
MKRRSALAWLCLAGAGAGAGMGAGASAADGDAPPLDPQNSTYVQHLGAQLPESARFRDADDRWVRIAELAHGRPMILVADYFRCRNLCGIVRASLYGALRKADLKAGHDYVIAVMSIDPSETSGQARAAADVDAVPLALPGADKSVHYLTGGAADIRAVAQAVGFRAQFDPRTRQFMHPAGLVFLTPHGIVSSYLLGVTYTPPQIRAALDRARLEGIAAAAAPILLVCFHFDAATGRYTLEIMKVLRLAAVLTVLVLGGTLLLIGRERHP